MSGVVGRDARTGATAVERARVVIGADGRNSLLARTVGATAYESSSASRSAISRACSDIEGSVLDALDALPGVGERVRAGRREERFYGATQLPNFLRTPYGPGWALVGDAGSHEDPFMAFGICDALRDADQDATNHFFRAIQGLVDP